MWNQEALGTIASNMADKTPVKPLRPSFYSEQYLCRCCNSSFANNPVDLFGPKYQSEKLLKITVFSNYIIGFNGAETNCRIAHILGILLMNSCNTDIFFSNYYHLLFVRFEHI